MSDIHALLTEGEIHRLYDRDFADKTAREAYTYALEDVGKTYKQNDDNSFHVLLTHSPKTFKVLNKFQDLADVDKTNLADLRIPQYDSVSGKFKFIDLLASNGISVGLWEDVKGIDDNGDVSVTGFQKTALNTERKNTISGSSFDGVNYIVTLPAGSYACFAWRQAYKTNRNHLELRDITNTFYYDGSAEFLPTSLNLVLRSLLHANFTITEETDFELWKYVQAGGFTQGFSASSSNNNKSVFGSLMILQYE